MHMSQVKGGIAIPSNGMVELKPGGYHVMLMGLKAPLKKGGKFMLKLTFKKAGQKTIHVPILGVGAKSATSNGHMGHNK